MFPNRESRNCRESTRTNYILARILVIILRFIWNDPHESEIAQGEIFPEAYNLTISLANQTIVEQIR